MRGVLGPVAESSSPSRPWPSSRSASSPRSSSRSPPSCATRSTSGSPGAVVGQLADQMRRLLASSSGDGLSLGVLPALVFLLVALLVLRGVPAAPGRRRARAARDRDPRGGAPDPRRRPAASAAPATPPPGRPAHRERGLPREPRATWAGPRPRGACESETPSEHARRLRDDPVGPALGRLAADYMLAEFGRSRAARRGAPARDRALAADPRDAGSLALRADPRPTGSRWRRADPSSGRTPSRPASRSPRATARAPSRPSRS